MKLNNFKKIKKQEFNPAFHWYSILMIDIILFLFIVLYSSYSFIYIKKQIKSIEVDSDNLMNSNISTESIKNNDQFLKNILDLKKNIEKYNQKEILYKKGLNIGLSSVKNSPTSTSTDVATSTN